MLICLHGRASGLDFGKNSIYFREEHKGQANNRPADSGASRRDRGQSNSRSVRLLACGLCRAALPEALAVEARAETEARTEEAIEIGHVVEAAVIAHLGHFHRGLHEQPAGYPEAVFIEGGDKCLSGLAAEPDAEGAAAHAHVRGDMVDGEAAAVIAADEYLHLLQPALPRKALTVCVLLFGCMTVLLCFDVDWLGVWGEGREAAYTVIGGWSLTPDQLLIGITRLLYPFFAGLLLSRMGHFIRVRGGFWWCALIVAVILVMPRIGGTSSMWMNGLYESLCILVMFPLVVSMGAGSTVTGKYSVAICKFFGNVSYPLYITHFPLVYMQSAWVHSHPAATLSQHIALNIGIYCLAIFNAYAAWKLYDMPVRQWLRRKLFAPVSK